jgi:hypothetical protein
MEIAQLVAQQGQLVNRNLRVKSLPCIACELLGIHMQPFPTESHHLNLGGRAGQKRRGNDFTIPLCGWHHRGLVSRHVDSNVMAALYGPSLAKQSKAFRTRLGTDDQLLALTNDRLEVA